MAAHARGTMSDSAIDAGYPHQAEVEVPGNGLGKRYTVMLDWARPFPHQKRSESHDRLRFCFADPAPADAFAAEFGAIRLTVEPPRVRRVVW